MKKAVYAVIAGLVLALSAGSAWATSPEDALKYRKAVYQVYKWNMDAMAAMARGEAPFDAERFALHAGRINAMREDAIEGYVENSAIGDTTSKPEIWTQWDAFMQRQNAFEQEIAKLAETAAGGDARAIRAQFGAVGQSCKACHDDFRVSR